MLACEVISRPTKKQFDVPSEELTLLKGDSSKIRNELGWKPEYTMETMLDEMIEYWGVKLQINL